MLTILLRLLEIFLIITIYRYSELYSSATSIRSETTVTVLYILSVCKAEEGSGVVPPLTDDNAADGKIGSAVRIISGRMGL